MQNRVYCLYFLPILLLYGISTDNIVAMEGRSSLTTMQTEQGFSEDERQLQCTDCNGQFKINALLKRHQVGIICGICNHKISCSKGFDIHHKQEHKYMKKQYLYQACNVCNQTFRTKKKLENHVDAECRFCAMKMCVCALTSHQCLNRQAQPFTQEQNVDMDLSPYPLPTTTEPNLAQNQQEAVKSPIEGDEYNSILLYLQYGVVDDIKFLDPNTNLATDTPQPLDLAVQDMISYYNGKLNKQYPHGIKFLYPSENLGRQQEEGEGEEEEEEETHFSYESPKLLAPTIQDLAAHDNAIRKACKVSSEVSNETSSPEQKSFMQQLLEMLSHEEVPYGITSGQTMAKETPFPAGKHDEEVEKIASEKPNGSNQKTESTYVCKYCLIDFRQLSDLTRHNPGYICGICRATIGCVNGLKKHFNIEHIGKKICYGCLYCKQTFNVNFQMTNHRNQAHHETPAITFCYDCEQFFASDNFV